MWKSALCVVRPLKERADVPIPGMRRVFLAFSGSMLQLIQNTIHNVTQPDRSGPGYSKPINTDPGLKVDRESLNFFCVKEFNVHAYVLWILRLVHVKTGGH